MITMTSRVKIPKTLTDSPKNHKRYSKRYYVITKKYIRAHVLPVITTWGRLKCNNKIANRGEVSGYAAGDLRGSTMPTTIRLIWTAGSQLISARLFVPITLFAMAPMIGFKYAIWLAERWYCSGLEVEEKRLCC